MAGFNGRGPSRLLDTREGVFAAQWLQMSGSLRSCYRCCTRPASEKALGVVYKEMTSGPGVLLFVPVQKTCRGSVGGHCIPFTLVGVAHKTEPGLVIVSPRGYVESWITGNPRSDVVRLANQKAT